MKSNIKINYIFYAGWKLFTIIVPLITAPYISRVLGAEGVGTYSYTFSIVSYFTLTATLGASAFGNRHIATVQDDAHMRSVEFWNIAIFRAVPTTVVTIIYFGYVIFFAKDKQIAALQSLHLLSVFVDVSWFFVGLEKFKTISIRNFIFKAINVICIFAFVKSRDDLPLYVLFLGGLTAVGNLAIWPYLRKYIVKVSPRELRPFKDTKTIIQLFIPAIACNLYAIVDKTMIGSFTSTVENGYYEQADKIINMSLMLVSALSSVMLPRVATESAKNNKENVERYVTKSCHFVWILGLPIAFGLIGISEFFVPIFFGDGYDKVKILLPIMSSLFLLKGMNDTLGYQYLIATNQQNKYTNIIVIGGLTNIVSNLLLIPKFGSIGAAIGSIIGEIVTCLIAFIFVSRTNQIEIKPIFLSARKSFIASVIMLLFIIILRMLFYDKMSGLFELIAVVVASIIIYGISLMLLKDDLVADVVNPLFCKLKNKLTKAN